MSKWCLIYLVTGLRLMLPTMQGELHSWKPLSGEGCQVQLLLERGALRDKIGCKKKSARALAQPTNENNRERYTRAGGSFETDRDDGVYTENTYQRDKDRRSIVQLLSPTRTGAMLCSKTHRTIQKVKLITLSALRTRSSCMARFQISESRLSGRQWLGWKEQENSFPCQQ